MLPLLPFSAPCITTTFVERRKRFSVLVEHDGEPLWIHSNNSGSMLGLTRRGAPVLASLASNLKRKLPYTQEAVWLGARHVADERGFWVGVNTSVPNKLLAAAFATGRLPFADGYTALTPEARYGQSRMDAHLQGPGLPDMWVECKNVTMVEDGVALFPDAVTERGQKHLQVLMELVASGCRAVNFYLIQRPDARCFAPADMIDPAYARLFRQALDAGVEMVPMVAHVDTRGIDLAHTLPLSKDYLPG